MKAFRSIASLCCLIVGGSLMTVSVMAGITPEQAETASVRIIRTYLAPNVDKDDKPVLDKDGKPEIVPYYGTGSGFVISNEGHVVTNQHVAGDLNDPKSEMWVIHREGSHVKSYYVPKEGKLWASANKDLALIQCRELHCKPLVLSIFDPAKGVEVYTHGYPGISDAGGSVGVLKHYLEEKTPKKGASDITDFLASDKRLANVVEPSFKSGNVTRLSTHTGFARIKDSPLIDVVDHTITEAHGNSGGPLINPWGEVIAVVGRGTTFTGKNLDRADWAIRITELKDALAEFHVPYTAASAPCTDMAIVGGPSQTKIIVAIVAAVLVAGAALVLAVLKPKGGQQMAVSYTRVIEAKFKELMGGRKSSLDLEERSIASPRQHSAPAASVPSNGQTWSLSGKTPDGHRIRLDLSESLFARNGNRLVIGRSRELCHLHLDDSSVSRQHAQIRKSERTFFVADRNSANGTSINGRRISQPLHEEPFREGDALNFGEVKLVFQKI